MKIPTYVVMTLTGLMIALGMAAGTPDSNSGTTKAAGISASTQSSTGKGQLRTVPFLTLRNRTGSDKAVEYFGSERSVLRAGICELSRKQIEPLKPIAEKAPFHIPDEIVKLDAVNEYSLEDFWRRLQHTSDGQAPVLYLHGFYISFERGCRRAVLLKESLGLAGRFLLFSWPSDGAITNYTHDEADLYWSVSPLQGVLADMAARFGTGKVNIVAHSLGTRGVMLALLLMAQAQQENRPMFNQVVLIAPDIDVGIFKQYLPSIRPLARNMTVYVSSKDSPLALSRQVHGYPRLGEAGEHLDGLTDIEIIDLSDIPVRMPSGHVYHLYQRLVSEDLDQLINENKPAAQRRKLARVSNNRWRLQR